MHDRLETTALVLAWVPATVTATLGNSSSSISLRLHLPKDYSGDATRTVVPGHKLFTSKLMGQAYWLEKYTEYQTQMRDYQ